MATTMFHLTTTVVSADANFWESAKDWTIYLLHHKGLFAPIFLLLIEEIGLPLPIPGDIIIAYTGYQVSRGVLSYHLAFIVIMIATLTGSSILYLLSSIWGQAIILRLGGHIHLDPKKLLYVEKQFKKYGPLFIIFGRHVPGLRIPITLFSGLSKITYRTFLISTLISVTFWIAFYLGLGMTLGSRTRLLLKGSPWHLFYLIIPLLLLILSYAFLRVRKFQAKNHK